MNVPDAHGDGPPPGAAGGRHVVVVAGGDVPARVALDAAWPGWDDDLVAVVAADRGLAGADALGLAADAIVGDLDSVDPSRLATAREAGISVVESAADKDESDTELAVLEAVRLGATRITILGGLGGDRLDHELANVWLLALDALGGVSAALLDERVRISLMEGPGPDGATVVRPLPGPVGATVSLLPFGGDVAGVTTRSLRYPLRDEPLVPGPARGLSNVRTGEDAGVTIRAGRLLIVEAARSESGLSSKA